MDIAKHEALFSKIRLSRYVTACKGDNYKGLKLYKYNIQACQALYPVISVLEVGLRNSIDRELCKHFKDDTWLLTKRSEFADHPDLVYKDKYGKEQPDLFFTEKLKKAEGKLLFKVSSITHVKLLAELTFGFWVKFFDTSPIKILKGAPLQAFTNKPGIKLAKVHSHLNSIVTLRNRISHSEPICFDRYGNLCLDTMRQYHFNIEDALRWLDPDLGAWAEKLNFYKPVIIRISNL
jgi:Abi-like protein.